MKASFIQTVSGSVDIHHNEKLQDIGALSKLVSVGGDVRIHNQHSTFAHVEDLFNLESVGRASAH